MTCLLTCRGIEARPLQTGNIKDLPLYIDPVEDQDENKTVKPVSSMSRKLIIEMMDLNCVVCTI